MGVQVCGRVCVQWYCLKVIACRLHCLINGMDIKINEKLNVTTEYWILFKTLHILAGSFSIRSHVRFLDQMLVIISSLSLIKAIEEKMTLIIDRWYWQQDTQTFMNPATCHILALSSLFSSCSARQLSTTGINTASFLHHRGKYCNGFGHEENLMDLGFRVEL